jgi:hypothetical protein
MTRQKLEPYETGVPGEPNLKAFIQTATERGLLHDRAKGL